MSDDEEVLEMNANGTFDFDATSAMNKHNWQTNEAAHPPSPPIAKKNIQGTYQRLSEKNIEKKMKCVLT